MKDQLDLWEDLPPYQRHSETSKAAAVAIEPKAGTLRGKVLAYLRGRGDFGATDEEGINFLAMSPSTYRPRRIELVERMLVRDSGVKRLTAANRKAVAWVAIEEP